MEASRNYKIILLLAVCLLLVVLPAVAKPSRSLLTHHPRRSLPEWQDCQHNDNTETLCQRCAKSTKSPMVYPMCCVNEEEVQIWCVRYLSYGLQ
ncbi:uncharacterized protein [Anabrus simplex]|uniref:uncharacterized protein n=1 Tax=Anabrus simplex TaxID=316456 RepID=UPI0035A2E5AC